MTELLGSAANVEFNKVPYKGAGPAFTDLIGGQVDLMFDNPGSSLAYVKSGKLRVIASTGLHRMPALPNVPAVAETLPGFEALNWFILAAPAGTPHAILDQLNRASAQALRAESLKQMFERDGIQPIGNSREQTTIFLRNEFARWDKIVRDNNLRTD